MRYVLLGVPCLRDHVAEALLDAGFARANELPRRGPRRATAFARGREVVTFETDMRSGIGMFGLDAGTSDGGDASVAALEALVAGFGPIETPAAMVERLAAEPRDAPRVRPLLALGHLATFVDHGIPMDRLAEVAAASLRAGSHGLRAAAVEVVLTLERPELDPAVAGLGAAVPELAWVEETWERIRSAQRAEAASETAAKARDTRWASLHERLEAGAIDDVVAITDELLGEHGGEPAAWRARALALARIEAPGRSPWEAAFAAAAWLALDDGARAEAEAALSAAIGRLSPAAGESLAALALPVARALRTRDDAGETAYRAFDALASRSEVRRPELGYLASCQLVGGMTTPGTSARVRPALEAFASAFPDSCAAFHKLGFVRFSCGEPALAIASYERAAELAVASRPLSTVAADLERFQHDLGEPDVAFVAPSPLAIWAECFYVARQKAPERAAGIAEQALALPFDPSDAAAMAKRLEVLRGRAMLHTERREHVEAIAAYRAAVEAEPATPGAAGDGTMRFNLACELAKSGHHEEALEWLARAIALDEDYADQALDDDYFEGVWDTPELARTVAPPGDDITEEGVATSQRRALGAHHRGAEEAFSLAHRAVSEALALGDDAALAVAWRTFGIIATYRKAPERGVRALERALAFAERVGVSELLGETWHQLGAALHAASEAAETPRWDAARAAYDQARRFRDADPATSPYRIAVSLGDVARLESARGDHALAMRLVEEAIASLRAFLAGEPSDDDALEASVNLALLLANAVPAARQAGAGWADVIGRARLAVDGMVELTAQGRRLPAGAPSRLRRNVASALVEMDGASIDDAAPLLDRLTILEFPDPAVRDARLYFARLVAGIQDLKARGETDASIARGLSAAIRAEPLPEPMASHPAFERLALELAKRLTAPTNLVMIAMALQMAEVGAQPVEEAVRSLEELAVANAEGYTDDDLEGDDDDDP